jgi:hypothetical protein
MTQPSYRTALLALLLPAAGAANAQTMPPPPTASAAPAAPAAPVGQMGDSMTLAQFQARQAERMMSADTDGDGRISQAEWLAQVKGRRGGSGGGYDPAQAFARMDTNHDGFVDRAEIDFASAERFRRMDTNGDGVVTPDERMAMRGGGMRGRGEHRGHGAPQDTPPTPPSAPQQ